MGRWPDRRPAGLHVDKGGSFLLSDLMYCWGDAHGLSTHDVLEAIYQNRYNNRSNYRRFSILQVPHFKDYVIKVFGKEDTGTQAPWMYRDDKTHDKEPESMHPNDDKTHDQDPEHPDNKDPLWKKYEDSNKLGTFWWYYEGPKGKWFMREDDTIPQQWWDDDGDLADEQADQASLTETS